MNPIVTNWMASHGLILAPDQVFPVHLPRTPRRALYALCEQLRLDKGAEIGVLRGLNSKAMLEANPRLSLLCVDPWKAYDAYHDYRRQTKMDAFHTEARANLAPFNGRVAIVREYSDRAVRGVPADALDFAYIDGNHIFDAAIVDIVEWSKRVRPGGLVAVHDYYRPKARHMQVADAVDAYLKAHRITEWFTVGGDCEEDGKIPPSAVWFKPEPLPFPEKRPEGQMPAVPEVKAAV